MRFYYNCMILRFVFLGGMSYNSQSSFAGQPSGPYLIWADISRQESPQTQFVRDYNKSERADEFCGEFSDSRIIYTHTRPVGFDNELLSNALVNNSKPAKQVLISRMRKFRDVDIENGVDGVVVYVDAHPSRMISIDIFGKISMSDVKTPGDRNSFIRSFCKILPRIFRD